MSEQQTDQRSSTLKQPWTPMARAAQRVTEGLEIDSANPSSDCPHCFDTGMEVVPGEGARRCRCQNEKRIQQFLLDANIPERYDGCELVSYKPLNESQVRAAAYMSGIVSEYPVDRGLLMIGSVGVGKTHLAASALRGIIRKGYQGLFVEFGALLKEIQRSYDQASNTTEWEVLSPVMTRPIVVIDELGASRPTAWASDILYQVINARYSRKWPTILTTNYLDSPAVGEESLEERIGPRLRSRLAEMCRTVTIEGKDYRRRKDAK